jgi:2-polyprenyl-6-hydroxyphenyl methylase/3-demethylubiquinone-9 3-methyltransferase
MPEPLAASSSVDPAEVAQFSALAAEFWDPRGKMRMLHRINPVRLRFIRDHACRQFGRDTGRLDCLTSLRVLDIGCGGGLLSEPLARLGASVVGADPSSDNIEVARRHAAEAGLTLDYRATTAEALAGEGEAFDLVLAMEVVEHVADVRAFIDSCAAMVKPSGLMIAATINRTLKSFALAIVGAEYLLGWLPRGTHRWDKLVTPNEIEAATERAGLRFIEIKGVVYDLLADAWKLSDDVDVNYMVAAARRD